MNIATMIPPDRPPVVLQVIEGRQAAERYLTEQLTAGYRLAQWHVEAVVRENIRPGSADRFSLLLVDTKAGL